MVNAALGLEKIENRWRKVKLPEPSVAYFLYLFFTRIFSIKMQFSLAYVVTWVGNWAAVLCHVTVCWWRWKLLSVAFGCHPIVDIPTPFPSNRFAFAVTVGERL
jgi:hypothetical protein